MIVQPEWKDARERALVYKDLFTGPVGVRVLEDLKHILGAYRTTFDPNPYQAAYNEGQRAVIVAITNTIALADLPPEPEEEPAEDHA